MAVTVSCPSCRAQLKLRAAPAPGAVGRCPRCKGAVPLDAPGSTADYSPPASPTLLAATRLDRAPPAPEPHPLDTGFLAPPQSPDELGRLGPYRVLSRIGVGGMGVVFRAEEPLLKREVALKVMLPQFASNPQWKARFLREARAQAAIQHDHVVAIHQVGEEVPAAGPEGVGGVAYIAMPLLKGETLAEALRKNPRPPLAEALRIGREVAEGLAAAHEVGLVHRDIKPSNIWLDDRRRRVKILDFGLARAADAAGADDATATEPRPDAPADDQALTVQGTIVGTPAYMSPEQACGLPADARTDLFSLGVVLYEMTTGALPFTGSTEVVLFAVKSLHPPAPAVRNPDLPPAVSDLVMRLLAKAPEGRPGSAEEVAAALERLEADLAAAPASATATAGIDSWSALGDEPGAEAPRASAGRGLTLALVAGAGLLAAGAVAAVLAFGPRRAAPDPDPPAAVKAPTAPKPPPPVAPPSAPEPPQVAPPPRPVLLRPPELPTEKHFRPYSSVVGDYRVLFPGFVRSQSTPFSDVGKDTVRYLTTDSVSWWNGVVFLVGFVDYPAAAAQQPAAARLDKFRDADKGPKSKILEETDVAVGEKKYPGRDLLVEVAGVLFVRKRIVIAGPRLYFVAVQGTKEAVTSAAADRFFNSFEITR